MKPAAQKAMFWRTVCHYILSRSVVLLVVSWLFSWSEIKWYYVSSSSSEKILMRCNSSNIAWIGCYMVKLLSPYCLHFYVLIGSIWWGLFFFKKKNYEIPKVAHWRYMVWSLKSQSFFILSDVFFVMKYLFVVFSFLIYVWLEFIFWLKITASGIWFLHFCAQFFTSFFVNIHLIMITPDIDTL